MQDLKYSPLQLSPKLGHWWWLRVQMFSSMVRRPTLTNYRSRGFARLIRRGPSSSYPPIFLPPKRARREHNWWIVFVHSFGLRADPRNAPPKCSSNQRLSHCASYLAAPSVATRATLSTIAYVAKRYAPYLPPDSAWSLGMNVPR